MATNTLHLTLNKKWFDMIVSGEKKEEYREIKCYWIKRLLSNIEYLTCLDDVEAVGAIYNDYDCIEFRNGYGNDRPYIILEFKGIRIGHGEKEWGATEECFVISLGQIIETGNIPSH